MRRKKAFDYGVACGGSAGCARAGRMAETRPDLEHLGDAEIATATRCHANMGHHPLSTCRMGRDEDMGAVLDCALRVCGVDWLRVVEASAFRGRISGDLNADVIMMAEKAAEMIAGKPPLPREYV